ncbi:DsbA family protein [Marinobacterium sp. YM272]|uniref:DsbA family protein n=1 Tax=Marinobacterium sp. YM272 TaxID=3421654 RepID=UPI003D7FEAD7
MLTVHYIFDPMCGWCYGATELMAELQQRARQGELALMLHPGGMMPRRAIDPGFRQHILQADQRIAELTGAEFGEPYQERVASNGPLVLDSMITAQAIIAGQSLGIDGVDLLKTIQQAHYQYGMDVADEATLRNLAVDLGADGAQWNDAMDAAELQLDSSLQQTRELMGRFGVQGFPALLVESDAGWQSLAHQSYYGNPAGWSRVLDQLID